MKILKVVIPVVFAAVVAFFVKKVLSDKEKMINPAGCVH